MVFRKAKMIARVKRGGKEHLINDEVNKIMDILDGKEVVKNDFKALVHGVEEYFIQVDGQYYPIYKEDCE